MDSTPCNKAFPFSMAGDIRPDHVVSLSGYAKDAAVVTEVQPSVDFTEIEITLDTGYSQRLPIDFPVTIVGQ